MLRLLALAALWVCVSAAHAQVGPDEKPYAVMVGDLAPEMPVARWWPRGELKVVQKGRPVVVEFWATWCIPCIAGVPHLTEVQELYGDRVTVVGVNVWDAEMKEVEKFVEGQGERMRYVVAIDSIPEPPAGTARDKKWAYEQGRMSVTWLKASGAEGIPVAYIVDGQGKIAWMGEPSKMDAVLEAVVEGKWDLPKAAAEHRGRMMVKKKSEPVIERLRKARQGKDSAGAPAAVDELMALGLAGYAGEKFEILLTEVGDAARASALLREAIGGVAKDEKGALNQIANVVLRQTEAARRDLDVALAASRRAEVVTEGKNSRTLKTLAEVYAARGEMGKAVEVMGRAIGVAYPEEKAEFEEMLARWKKRVR